MQTIKNYRIGKCCLCGMSNPYGMYICKRCYGILMGKTDVEIRHLIGELYRAKSREKARTLKRLFKARKQLQKKGVYNCLAECNSEENKCET